MDGERAGGEQGHECRVAEERAPGCVRGLTVVRDRRASRDRRQRDNEGERSDRADADEERAPADRQQGRADQRAAHEAEILHDALGRERMLVARSRDEVGEQGLLCGEQHAGGAAEEHDEREPEKHVAAHEREAAAEERQGGRGQEDRPSTADAIREASSDVTRDDRRDRRSGEGEPELGLR